MLLGVILVRVCELEFESYPSHILRLRKNDLFIYLIEQIIFIFLYCSLMFILYPLAVCKQSLQIIGLELAIDPLPQGQFLTL